MNFFNIISGPIIGGIIGSFTNYLAIKMLFRPLNPIKIGKYTLPFTPGIVPKRKDKLGGVLGSAIMEKFFTYDDLEDIFLSDYFKNAVTNSVIYSLYHEEKSETNTENENAKLITNETTSYDREQFISSLKDGICIRILAGFIKSDISSLITSEGSAIIKKSFSKSPIAKLVTDDMISTISKPLGEGIEEYLLKDGRRLIMPILDREFEELSNQSLGDILNDLEIEKDVMHNILNNLYTDFMRTRTRGIVEHINIGAIIESKIVEMNAKEIEDLTLSVVNRELNYVVILGAVIGVIIGAVNIFV